MFQKVVFSLNDEIVQIVVNMQTPLLYVLRNDFCLNGPKFGCGLGECGACSVLIDSRVVRSCITPLAAVVGREVHTLEGLGSISSPSVVQQAFIDEQAAQCGYCMNGMIVTATAFLQKCITKPSPQQIKNALRANLCRCGTHVEIIKAVETAAEKLFIDGAYPLKEEE
ncbi:(2Fe-2S)-binding protein [Marinomonas sp.]|nr:(2Fe-2S)-binding protein [Marinomonas sp.]MDB4836975.1 (2Fe-2S)-binding protein [Marinomonas sp.]